MFCIPMALAYRATSMRIKSLKAGASYSGSGRGGGFFAALSAVRNTLSKEVSNGVCACENGQRVGLFRQHFLYFLPDPHGQGLLRDIFRLFTGL